MLYLIMFRSEEKGIFPLSIILIIIKHYVWTTYNYLYFISIRDL